MNKFFEVFLSSLKNLFKRTLRSFGRFSLILILSLGIFIALFNTPFIQTKFSRGLIKLLNSKLETNFSIEQIKVSLLGNIEISNLKALDEEKNELFSVNKINAITSFYDLILNHKIISFKKIKLIEPNIFISTYKGRTSSNLDEFIKKFGNSENLSKNTFSLNGNIEIENAKIKIENENLPHEEKLIFLAKPLNIFIKKFSFSKNQFQAEIKKLNAKGIYKKDFEIKDFSSLVFLSSKKFQAKNFRLQSSKSFLKGELNLEFKDLKDLGDFTNKIKIKGQIFEGSTFGFEDLNAVVKTWDSKEKLKLQGKIEGFIAKEFVLSELKIENAKTKIYSPKIVFFKISDSKQFSIKEKDLFIHTSYEESQKLLPSFIKKEIPDFLKNYGQMSYMGPLEIKAKAIRVNGIIKGKKFGEANVAFELKDYRNTPIYKGTFFTKNFNLDLFLKRKISLSGQFDFEGKSFSLKELDINLKAQIKKLKTKSNDFENITINGQISGNSFEGSGFIKDSKLSAELDGKFVFSKNNILIKSNAEIENLDLKALKISSKEQKLSLSEFEVDLKGKNINELCGIISIENGIYTQEDKEYILPKSFISSNFIDEKNHHIKISAPDFIKADLIGKFIWKEIPDLVKHHFYFILNEKNPCIFSPKNSSIEFDLNIEPNFVNFFTENLIKLSHIKIKGEANQNKMILNLDLENLLLKQIAIKKANLKINTQKDKYLELFLSKAQVYGKKIEYLNLSSQREKNLVLIHTKGSIWQNQEFELNFYKKNEKEKRIIGFKPSYFFINNYKWEINKENNTKKNLIEFFLKKRTYNISSLELCSEDQKINLSASFKGKSFKFIEGKFDKVDLERIIPFGRTFKLKGKMVGLFSLENSKNILKPDIKFLIKNLNFNEKHLGNFSASTNFETKNKTYQVDARLADKNKETLSILGSLNNFNSKSKNLDLSVDFKNFPIDFLGSFLEGILSEVKGEALGKLRINGHYDNPTYKGDIQLKKAGLKVDYLNVFYELANDPFIKIDSNSLNLDHFILKDPKYNTQANLKGKVSHKKFLDWGVDFSIESEKLLVLDTSNSNNNFFYGKIFQKGATKILVDQKQVKIEAENSSILDNSIIFIHPQENKEEDHENFIKYIKPEKINKIFELDYFLNKELETKKDFFLSIATQINPDSQISIYLDKSSKSFIEAKGQGAILLKIAPDREIELTGKYTLEEGLFQYSYNDLPISLNKKFNVKKGSTITWTGKAINPYLEVNAYYKKFISNLNAFLERPAINQSGTNAELNIQVSGELSNPNFSIDIHFPDENQITEQSIKSKLESPSEKVKQFASILALGQFFINSSTSPSINNPNTNNNIGSFFYDIAFSKVNDILSLLGNNFFRFNLGYIQKDMNYPTGLRPQLSWQVHKRLAIEGALEFNFGMLNRENNARSNLEMLNLRIEVDVSKKIDNSLKLLLLFIRPTTLGIENNFIENTPNNDNNIAAFNDNNMAIFSSQTYGSGLVYNTKFNSFKELLRRIFTKKQKQN